MKKSKTASKKPVKQELPIDGERLEKKVRFGISNIMVTKDSFIQRLDDKVAIVIPCKNRTEAEKLVTSLGAEPAP